MKSKLLLAALVLAATPSLAIAACFGHGKEDVVMSCAEGTDYDPETQTCVPSTTS